MWKCSGCNLVQYCNKSCQKKHWHSHKVICNAAQTLSKMSERKTFNFRNASNSEPIVANCKTCWKRCTIDCKLDGILTQALWDTGAQVYIIAEHFLRRHFPNAKLKNISELLDCELDLTAANGTPIPYKGFIELTFKLKDEQDPIFVPFLITTEDISLPLDGYNVIELCVKTGITSPELECGFPSLTRDNVNVLFDIIDTSDDSAFCTVRTNKKQCLIKRERCSQIS